MSAIYDFRFMTINTDREYTHFVWVPLGQMCLSINYFLVFSQRYSD